MSSLAIPSSLAAITHSSARRRASEIVTLWRARNGFYHVFRDPLFFSGRDAADVNEFTVLLSPDTVAPSAMLEKIVSATGRRALDQATTGFYLDLTPPTDERPFFFNQLGFATLFDADMFSHFTHTGVVAGNLVATLTLVMLVLVSVALVGATIIVPLRPTVREAGWQLAVGGTVYFALIGVGFMMVEIALLQRMSVFLGHPVYALSVFCSARSSGQASAAWHPSACGLPEPASS